MPAFAGRRSPQEIWKIVLWIRCLAHLTPEERKKIERETSDQEHTHEFMGQGARPHDFGREKLKFALA